MKSSQPGCDTKPAVDAAPAKARHTVLIVDDDVFLRESYWAALLEAGYRGVAAASGKKVLEVMYTENVSVIVLDLFTPEMDGIDTLKAIKRVSPETQVVAMGEESSHFDYLTLATELGADAFIQKPASTAKVVETVKDLTSRNLVTNPNERRRYTRLKVDQRGYLYNPPNDQPLECRVVDLSAGGALIQSQFECPPDRPLVLHVDGFGSFEGVAVRNSAGSTGFKFLMGELKRDRLKHALASFAKSGVAPIGTYGTHPNFKAARSA